MKLWHWIRKRFFGSRRCGWVELGNLCSYCGDYTMPLGDEGIVYLCRKHAHAYRIMRDEQEERCKYRSG